MACSKMVLLKISNVSRGGVQPHTVGLVTPIGKKCEPTLYLPFLTLSGQFCSSSYARRCMELPYIKCDALSPQASVSCSHRLVFLLVTASSCLHTASPCCSSGFPIPLPSRVPPIRVSHSPRSKGRNGPERPRIALASITCFVKVKRGQTGGPISGKVAVTPTLKG